MTNDNRWGDSCGHPQAASLSELAEHIGLPLPFMSKFVDGLGGRKLATRDIPEGDWRRVTLELTARGRATLQSAFASAQS